MELGHEQAHILYQTVRNDSTGKDRLGVWYTHGEVTQETWTYRRAVGDEAVWSLSGERGVHKTLSWLPT